MRPDVALPQNPEPQKKNRSLSVSDREDKERLFVESKARGIRQRNEERREKEIEETQQIKSDINRSIKQRVKTAMAINTLLQYPLRKSFWSSNRFSSCILVDNQVREGRGATKK